MDFLEGVELQELLLKSGTLPLPRIVDLAMQISAGLGHAHARGIIHRDVKPANIVLVKSDDDEGRQVELVKVCDFGIAARTGASDLLGTPAYMSPEQCIGGEIDRRSDIYSLGVILYEMASGKVPFDADNFMGILTQHMYKSPAPIRALISRVDRLMQVLKSESISEMLPSPSS